MTLVRWSPYRAVRNFEREWSHLLSDSAGFGFGKGDWVPATEIVEKKKTYELDLELPGVAKEDVKISLEENVLTIEGEKKSEKNAEEDNVNVYERSYGTFTRSFSLPNTIDQEKIAASFKDGVLHLSIPKTEKAQPKQIDIQ